MRNSCLNGSAAGTRSAGGKCKLRKRSSDQFSYWRMKQHYKKVAAMMAVLAMTAAVGSTSVFAANWGGTGNPNQDEITERGDTTFSVIETTTAPGTQSFSCDIPLYVTMAVQSGQTAVAVPTNYSIRNTSVDNVKIGITGIDVTMLPGGSYNLVTSATNVGTNDKNLYLTIGGATAPALTGGSTATDSMNLDAATFGTTTGTGDAAVFTPNPIAQGDTLNLPLVGQVTAATRGNVPAAAQFKVKFTISAMNAGGTATAATPYAGDDSGLAGLGAWQAPGFGQ